MQAKDVMTQNTRTRTLYNEETGEVLARALEVHTDLLAFPVTTVRAFG